jgi:hypothetical protein
MKSNRPPPRYMDFLPAIYRRSNDDGPPLVESYLKAFEKILTGEDSAAADDTLFRTRGLGQTLDVLGDLFYPRFSFLFPEADADFIPPILGSGQENAETKLNGYVSATSAEYDARPESAFQQEFNAWLDDILDWMAERCGIVLKEVWDADLKRRVNATGLPTFRERGTRAGLERSLLQYADRKPVANNNANPQTSPIRSIRVYDLSLNYLPDVSGIALQTSGAPLAGYRVGETMRLSESYAEGMPLLDAIRPYAYLARIEFNTARPAAVDPALIEFEKTLSREQPAIGRRNVLECIPFTLGPDSATRLGINSYLAPADTAAFNLEGSA